MIIMRNLVKFFEGILCAVELINEGEVWVSFWLGFDYVYFGYDVRRKLQKYAYVTGLDIGCVYGNQLTGVVVIKDFIEFIQVKVKQVYKEI